jgi:hypothetical protein
MRKEEFGNVKVGDVVTIIVHGKNKGKQGIVSEISHKSPSKVGKVYLTPLNCTFDFCDVERKAVNKDWLFGWELRHVAYPEKAEKYLKPHKDKSFYVGVMFGDEGLSWPADNFTPKELEVIERFLEELNDNASGLTIDEIAIMDEEE